MSWATAMFGKANTGIREAPIQQLRDRLMLDDVHNLESTKEIEVDAVGGRMLHSTHHESSPELVSLGYDDKEQINEDILAKGTWNPDATWGGYPRTSAVIVVWMMNDLFGGKVNPQTGLGRLVKDWSEKLDDFIEDLRRHPIRGVIIGDKGAWWLSNHRMSISCSWHHHINWVFMLAVSLQTQQIRLAHER